MILSLYFLRQFIPPLIFGTVLFMFVLFLDKLFDIVDLIFNKGVNILIVIKLFSLFLPTVLPLTLPMAMLLACLVTFGRLSEENELTAVRAAGVSLFKVLWLPPLLAIVLSLIMVPFNTRIAPWANRAFRTMYGTIVSADPLISVEAKRFFSIKNIKIYAEGVDKKNNGLNDLFVYNLAAGEGPAERIFAHRGVVKSDANVFQLDLEEGQLQRYDAVDPSRLMHTTFKSYQIRINLKSSENENVMRFRNLSSSELKAAIRDLKSHGLPTAPLEAERSLRLAIAFAPICLLLVGIPLATVLRRGGRSFSFGVSIVVIFIYYTLLILGLTLAERGIIPSMPALWIGNALSLTTGVILIRRMGRQ